ncbi:MAG: hypothetical protein V7K92_13680, partial [Nostoc sp.]|uniref:hypothetical protein n=1 Tax=Nostoc sp. TaxID=1180 RepID=UPI002FF05D33
MVMLLSQLLKDLSLTILTSFLLLSNETALLPLKGMETSDSYCNCEIALPDTFQVVIFPLTKSPQGDENN